ncbi:MAG: hypothetical protein A3K10_08080 [Bacteroidetes bacterium RIFCSPLOWO2_12_FULL_31_6]|nr:MAG: hypothetical protein A3K10_08080 [Bacteroidetes bacterium RIFCSPLOWO2_12_FULL_31_6]
MAYKGYSPILRYASKVFLLASFFNALYIMLVISFMDLFYKNEALDISFISTSVIIFLYWLFISIAFSLPLYFLFFISQKKINTIFPKSFPKKAFKIIICLTFSSVLFFLIRDEFFKSVDYKMVLYPYLFALTFAILFFRHPLSNNIE